MGYKHIQVPSNGEKITVNEDYSLNVPNNPIIPYIEGDGIGVDITPVMIDVVNAAVDKAYGGKKKISWMEIYTGEKAAEMYDGDWFPEETLDAISAFRIVKTLCTMMRIRAQLRPIQKKYRTAHPSSA